MNKPQKKAHNRTLTPADKAASARLKALWEAHKARHRGHPTQDELAEVFGEGANQSLISQYMNGHIALNANAVRIFAAQLGVPTSAIRTDLDELQEGGDRNSAMKIARLESDIDALNMALGAMVAVMVHHRPAEAGELAEALKLLPPPFRDARIAVALHEGLIHATTKKRPAAR